MQGFIPKLGTNTVIVAAGALGALVMPYITFIQSNVVTGRLRDTNTDQKKNVVLK